MRLRKRGKRLVAVPEAKLPSLKPRRFARRWNAYGGKDQPASVQPEQPPRVRFADPPDLIRAEARRAQARERIVVGGGKRIVAADHESVDADAPGQIAQRLRVVQDRVVVKAAEVRRRRRGGGDSGGGAIAPLEHDVEAADDPGQRPSSVREDQLQPREPVEDAGA